MGGVRPAVPLRLFMFTVCVAHAGDTHVEAQQFDLAPTNSQGEQICSLIADFLSTKSNEFRERLPFLNRGDVDLEWSAAGGAALAVLFESGTPLTMSVLLSGVRPDDDELMLRAFRENVLGPIVGAETEAKMALGERPLLLTLAFPDKPEWLPAAHLLLTSTASVFFRCVQQLHAEEQGAGDA
jgi:hypothetical protein